MPQLELGAEVQAFLLSTAIGLLMGLERERVASAKAGLRTFALTAVFGCLCAMLGEQAGSPWVLGAGILVVAATIIFPYIVHPDGADPGTTSVAALLVCFGLGAITWYGYYQLAVMMAVVSTVLLYFKAQLQGITNRLTSGELVSIFQFAVLSLVILPVLPDRDYGPYGAFNPHEIWLMVVLISGVSLIGYAALRIVGAEHGAALLGLFGGLVSSTVTTMVFARNARDDPPATPAATLVILIANLVMMVRLIVLSAVFAPALLVSVALLIGPGIALGLAVALYRWKQLFGHGELPMPDVRNPTEMRAALGFGLLYGVILFLAAWLNDVAGNRGLYLVALVSGATDVDAITLSSLRLHSLAKLGATEAATSIALAMLANLAFKSALVAAIGGRKLATQVFPGMALAAAGTIAALLLAR